MPSDKRARNVHTIDLQYSDTADPGFDVRRMTDVVFHLVGTDVSSPVGTLVLQGSENGGESWVRLTVPEESCHLAAGVTYDAGILDLDGTAPFDAMVILTAGFPSLLRWQYYRTSGGTGDTLAVYLGGR